MRFFAIALLFFAVAATGGRTTVTIESSNLSFKQALAACPPGTLGAITMALGHVRIAEGPGTQSDIDDANPNAQSLMLVGSGGSANALIDASRRTVSANHVTLASRRRVACVSRD